MKQNAFLTYALEVSQIYYIRTSRIQIGINNLGFRNMQEKLDKDFTHRSYIEMMHMGQKRWHFCQKCVHAPIVAGVCNN